MQKKLGVAKEMGVWGEETSAFEMVLPPTLADLRQQVNLINNNLHDQYPIGGCTSHAESVTRATKLSECRGDCHMVQSLCAINDSLALSRFLLHITPQVVNNNLLPQIHRNFHQFH